MECKLIWISSGMQESFLLKEGTTTIGREGDNDIQIVSQGVSRYHAKIHNLPGIFEIEDLDSANGTFVDSSKVSTARLNHGSEIRMGDAVLRFEQSQHGEVTDSYLNPSDYSERSQQATVRLQKPPGGSTKDEPEPTPEPVKSEPVKPLRPVRPLQLRVKPDGA